MEMGFGVLLCLHLAASLVYFFVAAHSRGKIAAFCETVLALAIPVFGLLVLLVYRMACRIGGLDQHRPPKEEEEEVDVFTGNLDYDGNIVPLNDTFLMDDAKKKREFFTTAIKQNVVTNRGILRMAMGDSDRETAYYAVSLMTTKLEELENKLFAAEGELRQQAVDHKGVNLRKDDGEAAPAKGSWDKFRQQSVLEEYATALKEYLSYGDFIDSVTYRQKRRDYRETLGKLVHLLPERREYYAEEIRQLIALGEYEAAEEACQRFLQRFPQEERAYLAFVHLYEARRQPEKLRQKLAELKSCPIELSTEAMRVIRFWDKGAQHG